MAPIKIFDILKSFLFLPERKKKDTSHLVSVAKLRPGEGRFAFLASFSNQPIATLITNH